MQTLLEAMNDVLQNRTYTKEFQSVESFIENDDNSAKFIRALLDDPEYKSPEKTAGLDDVAKGRARHTAITFLMGLVFWDNFDLHKEFARMIYNSEDTTCNSRLWLLTSLYHDIGYFSERIKNEKLDYKKTFKRFLFSDEYEDDECMCLHNFSDKYPKVFAFSYDEILAYDEYAREYHSKHKNSAEMLDHGILGAQIAFNRCLKRKVSRTVTDLKEIKACALTIGQHNIFKSDSIDRDKQYPKILLPKLGYASPFRIGVDTPLLLFLCLVDTIECVKKFSKGESNDGKYLETMTVLSSIQLKLSNRMITLDLSLLHKRVNDKHNDDIKGIYHSYFESVVGLAKWTTFKTTCDTTKDLITITL